jgi:hypothetical protein
VENCCQLCLNVLAVDHFHVHDRVFNQVKDDNFLAWLKGEIPVFWPVAFLRLWSGVEARAKLIIATALATISSSGS